MSRVDRDTDAAVLRDAVRGLAEIIVEGAGLWDSVFNNLTDREAQALIDVFEAGGEDEAAAVVRDEREWDA